MPETNQQQNFKVTDAQSEKIRYGAPDGPRPKRSKKYEGREPIEFLGHEVVAQFMAGPETLREFKSVTALAKHFNVERKTVYCWMKDTDVLRRAEWLSIRNKVPGDLIARREWPGIIVKAVEMAKSGNIAAMKLCADWAWGKDQQSDISRLTEKTMDDLALEDDGEDRVSPTWKLRQIERQEAAASKAAEESRASEESKDEPE